MASKPYSVAGVPGRTMYVITRRRSDSYLIDHATGQFALAPATPCIPLVEDAIIRGLYERAESRAVWVNAEVTNFYYMQTGATAIPASDVIVATEDWAINNDTANDYVKVMASALVGKSTGGGTTRVVFRNISDTKDAIDGIVDAYGNRIIVNLGGI